MATRISESEARKMFLKNDLKPLEPFINTMQPWKSQCLRCKKKVSPNYNKVRLRGHQCGYCAGNLVDLKDVEAVMRNAGFIPQVPYPGNNFPWKVKCKKCKKITSPTYSNVFKGTGCKFCAGRAVEPRDAVAGMKARGFKTLEPFPGATNPWRVRCLTCKREFTTYFHSLNTNKGCKYCSGVALDPKDISKTLLRLHLKPLGKFQTVKTPWKLKCLKCQRISFLRYGTLIRKDRNVGGCPYCSHRRLDAKEIADTLKKNHLKPVGQYINGNSPWECICLKCERRVYPRLSDLRQGQKGCIYCAGLRKIEKDVVRLANECGFTPLVKYPGANKGWLCRCNVCGNESKPHYTSMQQSGSGCKFCKIGGFDFNKPAIVYLISHKKFGAYKIGVAGADEKNFRLRKHDKNGWVLYRQRKFLTGLEAFKVEQDILKWFLKKDISPYVAPELMPQGGSSETVGASEIDLQTIWAEVLKRSRAKK